MVVNITCGYTVSQLYYLPASVWMTFQPCHKGNVLLSSFVPEAHVLVGRPPVSWAMKQDEFHQELHLTIVPWYLSTITCWMSRCLLVGGGQRQTRKRIAKGETSHTNDNIRRSQRGSLSYLPTPHMMKLNLLMSASSVLYSITGDQFATSSTSLLQERWFKNLILWSYSARPG